MDFIKNYRPSEQLGGLLQSIRPLFLVGPTGSGKDTIQSELLKTDIFHKVVTYTSRKPRINHGKLEKEGDDYHFIDMDLAKSMSVDQRFIEVTIIHNYFYASSADDFLKAKELGKTPIQDIDVKGITSYKKLSNNFTAVFLLPISFNAMLERLLNRYGQTADKDDINNRLRTALSELKTLLEDDCYYVLINEDVENTVKHVLDIDSGHYKESRFSQEAMYLTKQMIYDINNYLRDHDKNS